MVFGIDPRQPAPEQVFNLRAEFHGVEPEAVGARFKGVNMNMGQLEYYVHWLAREDTRDGPVTFSGKGGVFACSIGVMQWQVIVRLQVGGRVYEVPFAFETTNPGS